MSYIVIPFVASIANNGTTADAAQQLQQLIQEYSAQGYRYVRLEKVTTTIAGTSGCFGIGSTPPVMRTFSMVVFEHLSVVQQMPQTPQVPPSLY